LNIAIMLDPSSAVSYYYRGLLYQSQGNRALAMADFMKTLSLAQDMELISQVEQAQQSLSANEVR
jgi:lipoprotein NlpI